MIAQEDFRGKDQQVPERSVQGCCEAALGYLLGREPQNWSMCGLAGVKQSKTSMPPRETLRLAMAGEGGWGLRPQESISFRGGNTGRPGMWQG